MSPRPARTGRPGLERTGTEGVGLAAGLRVDTIQMAFEAAAMGLGIALGRRPLVDQDLASGALVEVGLPAIEAETAYWLVGLRGGGAPAGPARLPALAAARGRGGRAGGRRAPDRLRLPHTVIASAAKQSRAARAEAWIASSASPPRNDGGVVASGRPDERVKILHPSSQPSLLPASPPLAIVGAGRGGPG